MTFLKHFLSTKLSPLNLLDMAYVVVLLPLALILKVPMIAFVIMVLGILYFQKKPAGNGLVFFVFLMGVLAVYLSMYGAFSFRGLSRLKLFLELLVYVLLVVVSMQRLTQKINFYLLISPFLFLALSLFFYHGIVMLIYVIFEVFFLLWMILSHRMGAKFIEGFRATVLMFMYSLPWVVLLFIFFPRISFEHADYGFKGESIKRMGHDGTMYLDGNALLVPSDRIVMEVGFNEAVPEAKDLYFRGSILYVDKKDHWEPLKSYPKRELRIPYPLQGEEIHYKVTLYPTNKRWLYLLDMPKRAVENSTLDRDLISTVKQNIKETIRYTASSVLSDRYSDTLDAITYKASTHYDPKQNPQTYKVAEILKNKYTSILKRAKALMTYFKKQSLTYTLKPDALDTKRATDSFLFDKRRGYCVHFASSFVTMARMSGIPARVVTGYKADKSQSLNKYLAVKEKDAHAWAELYIDKQWIRFETTNTASYIDAGSIALAAAQKKEKKNPLLQKVNLYLMYAKYQVETWILYYSHVRQLQLIDYAKKNPSFIIGFVLSFIGLFMVSFMIIAYFRRPKYSSEALRLMQPLLKSLKKEGYNRKREESMHQFLLGCIKNTPENSALKEVDRLYEEILYAKNTSKDREVKLKKVLKKLIHKNKH